MHPDLNETEIKAKYDEGKYYIANTTTMINFTFTTEVTDETEEEDTTETKEEENRFLESDEEEDEEEEPDTTDPEATSQTPITIPEELENTYNYYLMSAAD